MISLFKVIDISAFPGCDGLQNVSSDEFILFYSTGALLSMMKPLRDKSIILTKSKIGFP